MEFLQTTLASLQRSMVRALQKDYLEEFDLFLSEGNVFAKSNENRSQMRLLSCKLQGLKIPSPDVFRGEWTYEDIFGTGKRHLLMAGVLLIS